MTVDHSAPADALLKMNGLNLTSHSSLMILSPVAKNGPVRPPKRISNDELSVERYVSGLVAVSHA